MEVVGAAASITGILAIAGQSISGASKLATFYNNMKGARKKIDTLVRDLTSLKNSLENVKILLKLLESDEGQQNSASLLFVIGKPVENCTFDIAEMEKMVEEFSLGANGSRVTRLFKKARFALERHPFEEIKQNILLHHQRIDGSMALFKQLREVLGHFDIQSSSKSVGLTEQHLKLNDLLWEQAELTANIEANRQLGANTQASIQAPAILEAVAELKSGFNVNQ